MTSAQLTSVSGQVCNNTHIALLAEVTTPLAVCCNGVSGHSTSIPASCVSLIGVLATHIPYIAPRWELIGTALGVGRTVLSVRDTEKNADSKCLCVLEAWVEAGKEVSWQKLFQVLQDLELNDTVRKIQQSLQEEGGATS